jgi:hypothetical protein
MRPATRWTIGGCVRESGRSAGTEAASAAGRFIEGPEPGASAFVWGVWLLMSVAAIAFVATFAANVPVWDDYSVVAALLGDRPVTLHWLWEQCNEHRIALPKLILFWADRLAGNDVRAGMFLSVATLIALAAALVVLSARQSGGLRPSDAFFPILLLHVGQASNFLWSIQFIHVLPTALGTAFLIAIAARSSWPGLWTVVAAGFVLALLPLCGGTGLMYVPGLALWLLGAAIAGVPSARSEGPGRAILAPVALVPGLGFASFYFRGFRAGIHPESSGGVVDGARTGLQFLTGGMGAPAAMLWPWSGAVMVAMAVTGVVFLVRAWVAQPGERPRVFGMAAFLAAMLALAAGVGWGRGWAGYTAGFQERYFTMASPLWCWFVLVFRLYAPPAMGRLVANTLFAGVCAFLWPNTEAGLEYGRKVAAQATSLAGDLRAGMPTYRVIRKYTPFLHPSQDEVARLLPMLRDARWGPFGSLQNSPSFRETRLRLDPTRVYLARWDGTTAHVTGVDPQLTFTLPRPAPVAGIRINYAHANRQGAPARFQLSWKRPGQSSYTDVDRCTNWHLPTGEGRETTVWVDDVLEQFRIQPDNQPCEFRIDKITLLEP